MACILSFYNFIQIRFNPEEKSNWFNHDSYDAHVTQSVLIKIITNLNVFNIFLLTYARN